MIRAFLILATVAGTAHASATQVTGHGRAIDSTIIQIDEQRIMLFGVDSIMRKQTCMLDGKPWECWRAVLTDLQSLLDEGPAVCDVVGDPDVYGRLLARCSINDQSINEQLVKRGFAVARPSETTDYVAAEAAAKEQKVGLWKGQFVRPKEFRRSAGVAVERP
jgi:endonuclease YncB( thermonuclease family)